MRIAQIFSYCVVFLSLLIAFNQNAKAREERPPVFMEASFLKQDAKPGDFITLKLSYQLPKGTKLPGKLTVDGLEELTVISIKKTGDGIIVKLMVDVLDTLEIPSLTLPFIDENGKMHKMVSDPVSLKVTPTIEAGSHTRDIRHIKGIMPVNRKLWQKWTPYVLVALAALLGLWVWRIMKRRKNREGEIADLEPADRVALKSLEDLDRSGLFERGEVKAYYFLLSEIVRKYMEEIRPFPAYELTTDEIAAHAGNDADRKIVRLLRQADMVKFADDRPTVAQRKEHWSQARRYVKETLGVKEDQTAPTPSKER